jgi:hypothetical protein
MTQSMWLLLSSRIEYPLIARTITKSFEMLPSIAYLLILVEDLTNIRRISYASPHASLVTPAAGFINNPFNKE